MLRIARWIAVLPTLGIASAAHAMCPTGFLPVQSQGASLGCMQEAEETSTATETWLDAGLACWTAHGGRLPTLQEWWIARETLTLIDDGTEREWVADVQVISDVETAIGVRPTTAALGTIDGRAFRIDGTGIAENEVRCWVPSQGLFLGIIPTIAWWGAVFLTLGLLGAAIYALSPHRARQREFASRWETS